MELKTLLKKQNPHELGRNTYRTVSHVDINGVSSSQVEKETENVTPISQFFICKALNI